jgi:adenylate cyclase
MWQITIEGPGYLGSAFLLPDGVTSIGRAEDNDIVLTGTAVSRQHARLEVKEGRLYIEDLGSRNGSKVNHQPLKGTSSLRPGDSIQLGENELTVRQPARVENLFFETVDERSGGVLRRKGDLRSRVLLRRELRESKSYSGIHNLPLKLTGSGRFEAPDPILLLLTESADQTTDAESMQRTLDEALELVKTELNATTVAILLKHHGGALVPVAMGNKQGVLQSDVDVVEDVVQKVLSDGHGMAYDDSTPSVRKSTRVTGSENQMLCACIGQDPRQGVIVVNRPPQLAADLPKHLDLLNAVAQILAGALSHAQLEDKSRHEERLRGKLERFHAPHILEKRTAELIRQGQTSLTSMEQKTVTVLFADIDGFGALMQRLPPSRVVDLLNEFYDKMSRVIFSFEGTVDKFIGDSVMAIFGAPYSKKDDPVRAVRAALGLRLEWERAMNRRPAEERCKLKIGLALGKVLVGTVGSAALLDYTAVGEAVTLASWLSSTADSGQILANGELVKQVGNRFDSTVLGLRPFRDGKKKIQVAELSDEDRARETTL